MVGVAVAESMVMIGGRSNVYNVYKIFVANLPKSEERCKAICKGKCTKKCLEMATDSNGNLVFTPPSMACGLKDISATQAYVYDEQKHKQVWKNKLSLREVTSIEIVPPCKSLQRAATVLVSWLVQRCEKKVVECDSCKANGLPHKFRMCVNLAPKVAARNNIVTWTGEERKRFIDTQHQRGVANFSSWQRNNYITLSRSWWVDYVVQNKACPACTGPLKHKCMACKKDLINCMAQGVCAWCLTKKRFWYTRNTRNTRNKHVQ